MCFVYLARNFITFSLRNNSCMMVRSKAPKILQFSHFNSSKQYSDSKNLSNNEFDLSGSLKSYYKVDSEAITRGDAAKIKELEILLMKLELEMQMGTQLPKTINTDHWRKLLILSEEEMIEFMQHRLEIENLTESEEKERQKVMEYFENDSSSKGIFHSAILEHIPYLYDFNLLQAMRYGPNIVIDCGFEKVIPRYLIWSTAFHLFKAWLENRFFCNPSHIIYCNLNPDGEFFSLIMEMFKETNQDPTLFTWTSKSYLDLFPKENLIYLSPDSKNTMQKYNGKKVYIIGGLSNHYCDPITYKKAKLEEIQSAKLPIDVYVDWGRGPKKLSIFNSVNLLNDLKDGCSWNLVFRHLPKRAWARHAMDENKVQEFRKYRKPNNLIRNRFRQNYLNNLLR